MVAVMSKAVDDRDGEWAAGDEGEWSREAFPGQAGPSSAPHSL